MATTEEMLNTIGSWFRDQLGIAALENRLSAIEATNLSLKELLMALPEIVKSSIATEISEGLKLVELNTALKAEVEKLKGLLASTPTPGVGEAIVNLEELSAEIGKINPTPVSDAVVTETKENPEVPTPPIVESAPVPETTTIPDLGVAEAAVDAISEADEE